MCVVFTWESSKLSLSLSPVLGMTLNCSWVLGTMLNYIQCLEHPLKTASLGEEVTVTLLWPSAIWSFKWDTLTHQVTEDRLPRCVSLMIGQAFSLFFGLCGFFFFFYVFLSLMKLFTWKAIAWSNPSIFLLLFSLFFLPCLLFLFLSSSLFSYSFAFLDGPLDWKSNVKWLLWFALLVTEFTSSSTRVLSLLSPCYTIARQSYHRHVYTCCCWW